MKALAEYERRGWMEYAKDQPWAHGRRGLGERREDLVPKLRFSDYVLFCHHTDKVIKALEAMANDELKAHVLAVAGDRARALHAQRPRGAPRVTFSCTPARD